MRHLPKSLQAHLRNPQQPSIAIVTSQAAQFSVLGDLQLEAQRKAVRALAYYDRLTPYAVAENQIAKLGIPEARDSSLAASFDRNGVESPAGVCGRRRQSAHHRAARP